jgi:hypothetical protein
VKLLLREKCNEHMRIYGAKEETFVFFMTNDDREGESEREKVVNIESDNTHNSD